MPRDHGLALERTWLGWQRSSLSLAVIAALLLGEAVHSGQAAGIAAAILGIAAAAWAQDRGRRLYRRRARGGPAEAPGAVRGLALCTIGVALLAFAVVVGGD